MHADRQRIFAAVRCTVRREQVARHRSRITQLRHRLIRAFELVAVHRIRAARRHGACRHVGDLALLAYAADRHAVRTVRYRIRAEGDCVLRAAVHVRARTQGGAVVTLSQGLITHCRCLLCGCLTRCAQGCRTQSRGLCLDRAAIAKTAQCHAFGTGGFAVITERHRACVSRLRAQTQRRRVTTRCHAGRTHGQRTVVRGPA